MQQHALLSRVGDYGDEALDTIIQVMRKTRAGPGDATHLRAAMDVLDRIIGRPTQSLAASVIQRTVAADGTLIEGSAMMSPLLQAAQAHFVEEEMRQLAAPEAVDEPPPPPPTESVIVMPSVQIPEAPAMETPPPEPTPESKSDPTPETKPAKPPYSGIPAQAAAFMQAKEARRADLPGGQVPAKDWFQPDPQEGPEVVRFTRIPGGRGIRRC